MILEEFDVKKYEWTLREEGREEALVMAVEANMRNLQLDLAAACKALDTTTDEYYEAKRNK